MNLNKKDLTPEMRQDLWTVIQELNEMIGEFDKEVAEIKSPVIKSCGMALSASIKSLVVACVRLKLK